MEIATGSSSEEHADVGNNSSSSSLMRHGMERRMLSSLLL